MRTPSILSGVLILALLTIAAWADELRDLRDAMNANKYELAFQLARPLAENGNAFAQTTLGFLYSVGDGIPRDEKAAIVWWQRAANQGDAFAELELGDSYAHGWGVEQNFGEAAKWWRKAAEQGVTRAQTGLGVHLYSGLGLQEDKAEAARWFAKAADDKDADAQAMLSRMYYLGEGGLKSNNIEADKWAIIAGNDGAKLLLPGRDYIEMSMSAPEKKEAMHLAEQWKFDKGLTKSPPGPIPPDDKKFYFFTTRQLAAKCLYAKGNDLDWCDAYVAGVFDTLGANQSLDRQAGNLRYCLSTKAASLAQVREAVANVLMVFKKDKSDDFYLDLPAPNSVLAGLSTVLCH
jgi:hypothetical protein